MPAANRPSVLVFDVNETLLDIEALRPHFHRIFGDAGVVREWYGQLILYSMTVTMSGRYTDFSTLSRAVLQMMSDFHHVSMTDEDLNDLGTAIRTMPAHGDVADGLRMLADNGYRLVTLTNSPPHAGATPVDNAGLSGFFERQFSVDSQRAFKPAPQLYTGVATQLGVPASDCMMISCHAWDTLGAQAAGLAGALITRPGNAPLAVPALPQPDVIATDLVDLASQL
ncbi:haloacid dehalogenase type II [Mycolicibacterium agri]|uniref:Haloacid dehalogenase n=1 Tax=Mycolicibacterium agri TaxID=36811 RepID=A0A2A7MYF3_MYCAG|nr:haloacid dehalogenase type II [Mycolicibacterium agri]PEG36704.1 haloacid dehalogenase type II [Mycolicibacterium agri]GFG49179.1 haloacid dehalogenase [Mycolicibacterium agri]